MFLALNQVWCCAVRVWSGSAAEEANNDKDSRGGSEPSISVLRDVDAGEGTLLAVFPPPNVQLAMHSFRECAK